ncbi:receptor-activated Ca2+-permeable cation channel [Vararia minispora EC-137]|uniref:Receptor-activated Ca2+-permeable cation channel n=1 Tax=Vararia minispora EC-137 TaxID=1314806 RepID=A0ACB8QRA7_9AGAM|nr:receptor-activated Ca2+-permeable cation channel [Vararia minispora EC-137]
MECEVQTQPLLGPSFDAFDTVGVFPYIRALKRDANEVFLPLDSSLSWEQLTASDINFAVVRPLVFKYARINNPAIVYICLVVRAHFLSVVEENLAFAGVNLCRANFCEILAMKLVNNFASNKIELVSVLTISFSPLAGAPDSVISNVKRILGGDGHDKDDFQSALEMAVATRAKKFIATSIVQTIVNDIWSGRVVSHSISARSVIADNYKTQGVAIYDVRKAPLLDHYRLRVPKYGAMLEFLNFAVLFVTYILCLTYHDIYHLHTFEVVFIVFALAFALDEYTASMEHGWRIYIANMWNIFDTSFIVITLAYLFCRAKGLADGNEYLSQWGFDILACGACILLPRLAFFLVSNNMVVLALRAMGAEFIFFMGIAMICFSGVMFTLWTLGGDQWSLRAITWLMIQIWFGNTYLSFSQAASFHPVIGPILMTLFAALSSTLLLTILISILSNTFAKIDANASTEYLYQYTISALEGMKSDALISYQPPFNLLAFAILWPASFVLSPRALHTANVFLLRLTTFPILIVIHLYERFKLTHNSLWESLQWAMHSMYNSLPRPLKSIPVLDTLMRPDSNSIYDAIFDVETDLENEGDVDLFGSDAGRDHVGLHSWTSRRSAAEEAAVPVILPPTRVTHTESDTLLQVQDRGRSVPSSPRGRKASKNMPHAFNLESSPSPGQRSPLAKLFVGRHDTETVDKIDDSIRRMQEVLDETKKLPVNSLKAEIKELQERQARIESLLLALTRSMRHEVGVPGSGP